MQDEQTHIVFQITCGPDNVQLLNSLCILTYFISFQYVWIERFSIECCKTKTKTKTKAITVANHNKRKQQINQWELDVNTRNRPPARENACDQVARLVLVLHLIGWAGGASFLNQSQSVVKQNQSNSGLLSTLNWKPLYVLSFGLKVEDFTSLKRKKGKERLIAGYQWVHLVVAILAGNARAQYVLPLWAITSLAFTLLWLKPWVPARP